MLPSKLNIFHFIVIITPHRTHGRSACVCLYVCMSVGHVRQPAKTAEQIEMPFGWQTQVSPETHVSGGGLDS